MSILIIISIICAFPAIMLIMTWFLQKFANMNPKPYEEYAESSNSDKLDVDK